MGQIKYTVCERDPHKDQFNTEREAAKRFQQIVTKSKIHGTPRPNYIYKCKDQGDKKGCGYFHLGTRARTKAKKTRAQLIAEGVIRPLAEGVKSV